MYLKPRETNNNDDSDFVFSNNSGFSFTQRLADTRAVLLSFCLILLVLAYTA